MNIIKTYRLGLVALGLFSLTSLNAQQKNPGINLDLMDKSVRPQDDFFNFVNGTWNKNTQIPADKTRWGSFDELRQNTDKDALEILADAIKNPKYNSKTDQGKAISMYKVVMDTVGRNKQGINPLKPYLTKINAVTNLIELQKLLADMEPIGGIGFIAIGVGADEKNSNVNAVSVYPGSLGLPDKDYYNSDDKDSKEKERNTNYT